MKTFITAILLIFMNTSTFAMNADYDYTNSDDYDYTCAIKSEPIIDGLTVDKGDANKVKFAVNVNKNTCNIEGVFPVQVFWEIGKKEKNGVIPCQGLTNSMRKYFGYKKSDIERLSPKSIRMNLDIISEASDIITPQIVIDVEKVDGQCVSTVLFEVDGQELEVDTLKVDLGLFGVSEVALINDGEVLYAE